MKKVFNLLKDIIAKRNQTEYSVGVMKVHSPTDGDLYVFHVKANSVDEARTYIQDRIDKGDHILYVLVRDRGRK